MVAASGAGVCNVRFAMADSRMTIYRRIGASFEYWRVVVGDPTVLARARWTALELDQLASELGGWAQALRLGLYPAKPIHSAGVSSGVFLQDKLNGRFREL